MPKMYHDIEGLPRPDWPGVPIQSNRVRPSPVVLDGKRTRDLWKYPALRRTPETLWLALFISLNAHLLLFFGFNEGAAPEEAPISLDDSTVVQIALPDLKDLDEEKPVEELSDVEPEPDPGVLVPMLADVPTIVPMDAFTQKVDYRPPVVTDKSGPKLTAIPVRISRSAAVEKLGKIFDLSQLDRVPELLVQPAPVFPSGLKREYSQATVMVGFVVNAQGEVVAPHVINSSYFGFEQAALTGVEKWKFRPGMKGGRKVNTRMQVEIRFTIKDAE